MNIYSSLFQHKGLSLERLQSFCLVAENKGFNKAAGENPYKQAQFSKQIADLEKFFGSSLFIRKSRTIELTPQGQELYSKCKGFFYGLHSLKIGGSLKKQNLVISAGQSVIDFLMPNAFNDETLRKISNIKFISRASDEALEDVLSYSSHCALIARPTNNKDIVSIKLLSSPVVMIFSKNHANEFYVGSDIKKLSQNPIALIQGQGDLHNSLLKLFKNIKPNILFEAPTFLALKQIALTGKAVSFVPQYSLTKEDADKLSIAPLPTKSHIERSIYIIYRKNLANQNKPLAGIIKQLTKNITS